MNKHYATVLNRQDESDMPFKVLNFPVAADGSENVTGLDLSDFPALADRSRREGTGNPTPVLNPLAGRAPYGRPLGWRKCRIFTHIELKAAGSPRRGNGH